MKIISYRPGDDQFWIACTKEEAEKWFVPHLSERDKETYENVIRENEQRSPLERDIYETMIKNVMRVSEVAYAYFNVSRDLSVCYSDVAHHPFNHLWNAYNPFRRCDHVEIQSPDELKDIVMTWDGKTFDEFNRIKGKNK